MAQVTFTNRANIIAGQPENVNDVLACIDQLQAGVNNVEADQIVDGTITAAELAADSVNTSEIVNAAVTAAKLATDAVETAKIKDANVTYAKLATDAKDAFLKLDVPGDKELRFGKQAIANWGGANYNAVAISHGLGRTPDFAVAFAKYIGGPSTSTGNDEVVTASVYGLDSSTLTVAMRLSSAATSSAATDVYWAVIG